MSSFDWELDKLTKKKKKNQCSNEAEEQLHKHITNELGNKGSKGGEGERKQSNDSLHLKCA